MRVLHLVCSDGFAGVERYVATTARTLASHGAEVEVVGGREDAMRAALDGTAVTWSPGGSVGEALRQAVRTRADLVNAHMTEAELVGTVVGTVRRVPVVATRHFGTVRGSSRLVRAVGRGVERRLAAEIAISDFVAREAGGTYDVVHSGVPSSEHTLGSSRRSPTVLVAQRLEAEKNTETAVRAWAASRLGDDGWRLEIAGAGSEEAALRRLADSLGVTAQVDFLGHRDDLPSLYDRAAVLLAPTPLEGLGLSVVEAMAHGLPVVATAAGGHLETAGSVPDAALFAPGDSEGAARLLRALADDAPRRDRYGSALQQRQRDYFTLDRQARDTLAVYERVLAR
ncbi:glycosyltransferase family 4 protein [Mumia sp. DW29H23]|uniref:glycosyltransferase family 4 protein n=1 Tax=Mumia sp. DW29H23 TaxID=3421241 RepID=UPI003D69FD49